jgi:hypothetical protein
MPANSRWDLIQRLKGEDKLDVRNQFLFPFQSRDSNNVIPQNSEIEVVTSGETSSN